MERQARAAALRRRRLESRRLGERRQRRQPHGRLYAVRVRHHVGPEKGANDIRVRVWDPTDDGYQPRGKQVNRPEGIWYTPRERHLADGMVSKQCPSNISSR